jgi:CheY-like chemotaxis protein
MRVGSPVEREEVSDVLPDTPSGGATILVVEDDEGVREVTVGMLSDLGYHTLVACTGREALEVLEREKAIDLLFTDVVMPGGISGVELARTARRLQPRLKILVTSGYTRAEPDMAAARREFPFLPKPYRLHMLGRKLKEILAGEGPAPAPA